MKIKQGASIDGCIGHDPYCPCQDGDPCHYLDYGDTKAMNEVVKDAFAYGAGFHKNGERIDPELVFSNHNTIK